MKTLIEIEEPPINGQRYMTIESYGCNGLSIEISFDGNDETYAVDRNELMAALVGFDCLESRLEKLNEE